MPAGHAAAVAKAGAGAASKRPLADDSLMERWQRSGAGLLGLVSKSPVWAASLGTHVLEYEGRADIPSVKNVQLVQDRRGAGGAEGGEREGPLFFQMGKVGEGVFSVDWRAPLSPMAAFGLALSVLDGKPALARKAGSVRSAMRLALRGPGGSGIAP